MLGPEDHRGQFRGARDAAGAAPRARLVWDMPVRVSHWTFVACVAGAWLTQGGERNDAHLAFGYSALAALVFRLSWGFAGSRHARFADFAYSPAEAWRYLRDAVAGRARHYTGHNPAGSFAVWVLLALLAATIASGVASSGAMHGLGPLADAVSPGVARVAHELHEASAWAILGFAAFHVAGVAWGSRVHRENLAAAMVTGRKLDHDPSAPESPRHAFAGALLVVAIAVGVAYDLLVHVPRDVEARMAGEAQRRAADAASPWTHECSECHLAYTPGLLPARSWDRMLDEQDRHFGEDLSLPPAKIAQLRAAIRGPRTPAESRSVRSVPAAQSPQRITELRWWKHVHEEVEPSRFKPPYASGPHECNSCHRDAASGIFHPRMIQHPKPRSVP